MIASAVTLSVPALVSLACNPPITDEPESIGIEETMAVQLTQAAVLSYSTITQATTARKSTATTMSLPMSPPLVTSPPLVIPEDRRLMLEWSSKIRVGDTGIIRLILETDSSGNVTTTAIVNGKGIGDEPVKIPNIYSTHNIVAEAQLDLTGIQYTPSGEVGESMRSGLPVKFLWSVRPRKAGTYHGAIWVHLRFIPLDGGAHSRNVLTAQLIEIEAVDFLGLGGTAARVLGSVGIVVGSALSMDKLLSWLLNNIRK